MMMNKTIRELERDRQNKIRSLNLNETKSYISNLHNKMFMSDDKDEIDLCSDKIIEAFDLMNKNYLLDVYSAYWSCQLQSCHDLIDEKDLKIKYLIASHSFEVFDNGYWSLLVDFEALKDLFKIYYHRYIRQSNEIDHILNELDEFYDFKDQDFSKYLKQEFHLNDDFHFASYIRIAISNLVLSLKYLINHIERHEKRFNDEYIQSQLNLIQEKRKDNDFKKKSYLELLDDYENLMNYLADFKVGYVKLKNEVLEFLSKEDGFEDEKLKYYHHYEDLFDLDKEAILNDKPKFDFENLKLDFR